MSTTGPSKQQVQNTQAINDLFQQMQDITGDITRNLEAIKEEEVAILSATDRSVRLAQQERQLKKEIQRLAAIESGLVANTANLTKKQIKDKQKQLDIAGENLKQAKELNKRTIKTRNSLAQVNDQAQNLVESAQSFVSSLPGGDALVKKLGFDTLGARFEDSLNSAAQAYNEGIDSGLSSAEAVNKAMTQFGGSINSLIGGTTLAIAAVAALVALFISVNKQAKELATATGLTVAQTQKLIYDSNQVVGNFGVQLATQEDILDVQKETVKQFGFLGALTARQAADVADIGKAFGFGAEQAAKVNTQFMMMGMNATQAADAQRDLAAEAVKAGVNVGTVVADIADNAKDTAKFFGGNVKALRKAAIEAAKLGVSIKTMVTVSDSLLNIEESLTSQFELQALTGKEINLDLARSLALQGDIAGATKQVLDQVGGIAEFNAMNVVEREALAKATGMSADELQRSLAIQSKLGNLTEDQLNAVNGLGLSTSQIQSMNSKDLQTRLAQQQAADKTAQAFSVLKAELVNALMPAAEALMGIFQAFSPLFKVLGYTLYAAFIPIKIIGEMVKEVLKSFSDLKQMISGNTEGLSFMQQLLAAILGIATAYSAVMLTVLTYKKLQLVFDKKGLKANLKSVFVGVGGAIADIYRTFAKIPFGLGIPLAIAAGAGLIALVTKFVTKTGDLGIDPNGGPIVASPRVGGIFQGDRRDGLSMGPGMGTNPDMGGGGGGGNVVIDYQKIGLAVASAMSKVTISAPPVQIGEKVIEEVGIQLNERTSFTKGRR